MPTRARSASRHFSRMESAMPLMRWAMSCLVRIGAESGIDWAICGESHRMQAHKVKGPEWAFQFVPVRAGNPFTLALLRELQDAMREHARIQTRLAVQAHGAERHLAGNLADGQERID